MKEVSASLTHLKLEMRPLSNSGALLAVLCCSWLCDGFVWLKTGRSSDKDNQRDRTKKVASLRSCLSTQLSFN